MPPTDYMTRAEMEELIEHTVKKTLTSLGMDLTSPTEVQRDFQSLRDWRKAMSVMRSVGAITVITTLTGGALTALWIGIKHAFNK